MPIIIRNYSSKNINELPLMIKSYYMESKLYVLGFSTACCNVDIAWSSHRDQWLGIITLAKTFQHIIRMMIIIDNNNDDEKEDITSSLYTRVCSIWSSLKRGYRKLALKDNILAQPCPRIQHNGFPIQNSRRITQENLMRFGCRAITHVT